MTHGPFFRMLILISIFISLTLIARNSTSEDMCDRSLKPSKGNYGYVKRNNRCEGMYERKVKISETLDIVRVIRGNIQYELKDRVIIEVIGPHQPPLPNEFIRVRAIALPRRTYYQMDARLENNRLLWPAGEVLVHFHLYAYRIGVFGWIGSEEEKIFIPVQVIQRGNTASDSSEAITIRTAEDIEALKWRFHVEGQPPQLPYVWRDVIKNPLQAGDIADITLPDGPPKVLKVEITAKKKQSNDWLNRTIRVFRSGRK